MLASVFVVFSSISEELGAGFNFKYVLYGNKWLVCHLRSLGDPWTLSPTPPGHRTNLSMCLYPLMCDCCKMTRARQVQRWDGWCVYEIPALRTTECSSSWETREGTRYGGHPCRNGPTPWHLSERNIAQNPLTHT
jgi:hypothetical protein